MATSVVVATIYSPSALLNPPAIKPTRSKSSNSISFNSTFAGERLVLNSTYKKQCSSWSSLPSIVCKHKVHTKLKTNKSVVKRFRVTGRGIIMRRKSGKQHLLVKKRSNRRHRLKKMVPVKRCDYRAIVRACPYMKVKRKNTLASKVPQRLPETSPAVCLKRKVLLYKARIAARKEASAEAGTREETTSSES